MAKSPQRKVQDASIGHSVDLHAYTNSVVRKIISLLNSSDASLMESIRTALDRMPASEFTVARLDALLSSARLINEQAYAQVGKQLDRDLAEFAQYEASFQEKLLRFTVPEPTRVNSIVPEQAYAAAVTKPMQGRLMSKWASSLSEQRMRRIEDTLAIAYTQGRTVDEMIREVRGTKAQRYQDGLLQIDRRNAEAIVRTSTAHVASVAREEVYRVNKDLISAEVWSSTLDTRTTPLCQVRDGHRYTVDTHEPIGHKIPWLGGPGQIHWNCRSSSYPELRLAEALGFKASAGQRAAMDGPVSAKVTYGEWLKAQSKERQDDVLGPTRAAAFRAGKITFERFFDNKGRLLTLDELRSRDASLLSEK